ncbi:peroxide stress protein YaaA [uncultured Microbacterium sp.]|uniref:YaaA family protein n=1 Tax=uncultured Microbacterium sp. TaxID=191216 RepID=UPI0025D5F26D|nr:peroxide stress protein YaaA [uncultured Microbacterium sp.]
MLILLPPSETKRPGGGGPPLDVGRLALSGLASHRNTVITALSDLSADAERATRVLKLGRSAERDLAANLALRSAPTMPAIDRYTGVLFDALGADELDPAARTWLGDHVLIHSAPFGPIGALDPIPDYRLAAGTALPGVAPLRRHWAEAVSGELAVVEASFILDLRSEAYVALGPVPDQRESAFGRVVTETSGGVVRALNHFNKHAKGELVRHLARTRPDVRNAADLMAWGGRNAWVIRPNSGGVEIVVHNPAGKS